MHTFTVNLRLILYRLPHSGIELANWFTRKPTMLFSSHTMKMMKCGIQHHVDLVTQKEIINMIINVK